MAEFRLIGSPECPNCGSKWVAWRKLLETWVCRKCGETWKDLETARKLKIQRIESEIAVKKQELDSLKSGVV